MRLQRANRFRKIAIAGILALGATSARAEFLTGVVVYSTDAAGAASSGEYWNTLGGDNRYNVYVSTGPSDPILNPGDSASTSISLPLPVGTYTYDIYGDNAPAFSNYGIGLYFNGNNTNPGIAAYVDPTTMVVPVADGSVALEQRGGDLAGLAGFRRRSDHGDAHVVRLGRPDDRRP